MEMYTTNESPIAAYGSPPPAEAWLVTADRGNLQQALSAIDEQAAERSADAIVGLRIAVAQSESGQGSGRSFVVYGTAVKYF
ncbi:heavy metal-binding domain-containing protein [Streptomyces sp. NPDC005336]|uniref:heavy metal-binding domain-containing protein n=1 Tax=Streptomyces sp. NPDC005336 TaxID=3157035 RepID=UPI0033B55721